ncbi:MAG TPA: hypothetical protein VMZ53_34045 [Kofleriaceae bacterium]|nr:hypothetical protein [Kofleriaceae bacterium]
MSWLRTAALLVASTSLAHANDVSPPVSAPVQDDGPIHRMLADVKARLDAAIVARPPKLVPPKKVAIKWKLAKLGTVDLGAPLVALTGADLDGDGHGELYAVTSREVIALALKGKKLDEIGRVAFAGDRTSPMPRDVVGTIVVDGNAVIASVSAFTRGMRVTWKGSTAGKGLAGELGDAGFVVCPGEAAQLAPGRNYFGADEKTAVYGVRCKAGLVEPDGHPLRLRAALGVATARLSVDVERCAAANLGCTPTGHFEYPNAGFAFDLADVERDGKPEVIYAASGAPGDPDILRVITLGDDDKKHPRLKRQFAAGGVAGLAVVDLDGDGVDEVIAGVRLVGASRVDLWRLE